MRKLLWHFTCFPYWHTMFIIDHHRMREMAAHPPRPISATDLCREGRAFFVGGALPIRETLETMFLSDCSASTDLFIVTCGQSDHFRNAVEMVGAIKKNFNIRLMVRLEHPIAEQRFAQVYAAGADLAEIVAPGPSLRTGLAAAGYQAALAAFPRWSVAAPLLVDGSSSKAQMGRINELLPLGVVPLPRLIWDGSTETEKECGAVLQHLVKAWHQHKVPIKPFLAAVTFASPLVLSHKPGALRSLFDRLHERRQLAASDLLRHLRVTSPTDSLDSAGL